MSRRCRRQRRDLLRYVDEDLSVDRALDYQEHLEECPSCQQAVRRHQTLEECLLSLPRPVLHEADRERLMQGIHARTEPVATTTAPARWPRPLALAAAALIGALGLWILQHLTNPAPQPVEVVSAPPPATPEAEPVVILSPPPVNREELEARRALRQRVEELLAQRPAGEWHATRFFEAAGELASTRVLVQALESHLDHADTDLARSAARILGQHARDEGLGVASFTVVASLERQMRRSDRAESMFEALLAMDGDVVRRTLLRAFDLPTLRSHALLELVTRDEPELLPTRERLLLTLLRSGQPTDHQLLEWALARMRSTDPQSLRLLAELYDQGAPHQALHQALSRLDPEVVAALEASVSGRGPLPSRTAVQLAGLAGDAVYAEALARRAHRSRDSAEAIDALVEIGGMPGFRHLLELSLNSSCSLSRRSLARDACVTLLQRTTQREALLVWACTETDLESSWESVLRIAAAVPGSPGNQLLLALAEDRRLTDDVRATASVHLALRVADAPDAGVDQTQALLDLLAREVQTDPVSRTPVAHDQLLASMLVSLYLVSDEEGLSRGVETLGLDLTRRQEGSLLRLVQSATDRVFSTRFTSCVDQIGRLITAGP